MRKLPPLNRKRAISLLLGIGIPVLFVFVWLALLTGGIAILPEILAIIVTLGIIKKKKPSFFSALRRNRGTEASLRLTQDPPPDRAPSKRAYIMLVPLNAVNKDRIIVNESPFVIGCSPTASFQLDNPWVSRRHLTVEYNSDDKLCYVTDSSTNGTYLNSEKLASGVKKPLHQGDALQIAKIVFSVEYVHY